MMIWAWVLPLLTTVLAQDEIVHTYRPQETRPHPMLSYAFTGAIGFVFLVWFISTQRIGTNSRNAKAVVFAYLGLVVVIIGMLVVFWMHMPLLELVRYLLVLGLPLYYFGTKILAN
jgi:hypothetical protein